MATFGLALRRCMFSVLPSRRIMHRGACKQPISRHSHTHAISAASTEAHLAIPSFTSAFLFRGHLHRLTPPFLLLVPRCRFASTSRWERRQRQNKKKMSKKKQQQEEPGKVFLTRPSNTLRMGIVGLPNVGKSTLFNVLCKMNIPAENFPFCTVDPNVSQVAVPDERFDDLVDGFSPKLPHITHVEETIDPVRDLDIISYELRAKDLEFMTKKVTTFEKTTARADKTKQAELLILKKILAVLEEGKDIRSQQWNAKELITAKPIVYLINMSEQGFIKKKSKWFKPIKEWIDKAEGEGATIIPFCGAWEGELLDKSDEELKEYLSSTKCQSMIPKIIKTAYHSLGLIHFFTCGADEVRAWTIRSGTLAPSAAGTIHTDFERGFVCAEVYSYEDWVSHEKNEQKVKGDGKCRQQGKQYVMKDGDIVFFKVNAGGGLKKK